MRIDAHQHFWSLARGDYGWLTPELKPIYRDFLPEDLKPLLDLAGIAGTVLVQAAPSLAETEFLLSIAERHPFVRGVVGWVDFEGADAPAQIARLAGHPALVGLRPMIQDIADTDWMLRDALAPAFAAMQTHGLTFDALVLPGHLGNLRRLLARHSGLRVVIDHGAKPPIRDGVLAGWADDMAALAEETNAFCKLSGLITEAGAAWRAADLKPYADHLLEHFGPARLIWGSDWPVCTLAGSYARWLEATDTLLAGIPAADRDAILGGNAVRAYALKA